MSTTAQAQHPLHKPYAAMYVSLIEQTADQAALLLALYRRRGKHSPEKEAIFYGHSELKAKTEKLVAAALERGLLLFIGQPAAVDAARLIEREKGAAC